MLIYCVHWHMDHALALSVLSARSDRVINMEKKMGTSK